MKSVAGHISLDPLMEDKLIVDMMPLMEELPNGTILGNYSLRVPNGLRVINSRYTRRLPMTKLTDTETAFTRCFLKSLPKRKVRKEQIIARPNSRPPQYCVPSVSNVDTLYIDISSAYLSIYERMSWRIEYLRNRYFSNDDDKLVYPFPREWKRGRSYVVTGSLPGTLHLVMDNKVIVRPSVNPHENPPLVCAVWDVLSAIGRYAVHYFKARYFNLDGAVVPQSTASGYMTFLDSLGLSHHIKAEGRADIRNLAAWEIGKDKTKRFEPSSLSVITDAIPMDIQTAKWVLDRFARL